MCDIEGHSSKAKPGDECERGIWFMQKYMVYAKNKLRTVAISDNFRKPRSFGNCGKLCIYEYFVVLKFLVYVN